MRDFIANAFWIVAFIGYAILLFFAFKYAKKIDKENGKK